MSWNKRNKCNNIHGATMKIINEHVVSPKECNQLGNYAGVNQPEQYKLQWNPLITTSDYTTPRI